MKYFTNKHYSNSKFTALIENLETLDRAMGIVFREFESYLLKVKNSTYVHVEENSFAKRFSILLNLWETSLKGVIDNKLSTKLSPEIEMFINQFVKDNISAIYEKIYLPITMNSQLLGDNFQFEATQTIISTIIIEVQLYNWIRVLHSQIKSKSILFDALESLVADDISKFYQLLSYINEKTPQDSYAYLCKGNAWQEKVIPGLFNENATIESPYLKGGQYHCKTHNEVTAYSAAELKSQEAQFLVGKQLHSNVERLSLYRMICELLNIKTVYSPHMAQVAIDSIPILLEGGLLFQSGVIIKNIHEQFATIDERTLSSEGCKALQEQQQIMEILMATFADCFAGKFKDSYALIKLPKHFDQTDFTCSVVRNGFQLNLRLQANVNVCLLKGLYSVLKDLHKTIYDRKLNQITIVNCFLMKEKTFFDALREFLDSIAMKQQLKVENEDVEGRNLQILTKPSQSSEQTIMELVDSLKLTEESQNTTPNLTNNKSNDTVEQKAPRVKTRKEPDLLQASKLKRETDPNLEQKVKKLHQKNYALLNGHDVTDGIFTAPNSYPMPIYQKGPTVKDLGCTKVSNESLSAYRFYDSKLPQEIELFGLIDISNITERVKPLLPLFKNALQDKSVVSPPNKGIRRVKRLGYQYKLAINDDPRIYGHIVERIQTEEGHSRIIVQFDRVEESHKRNRIEKSSKS